MEFFDLKKAAYGTLQLTLAALADGIAEVVIGECCKAGRVDREPGGSRYAAVARIHFHQGVGIYDFPVPAHKTPWKMDHNCHTPLDVEIAPFRYVEINGDCRVLQVKRREVFPAEFCDGDSDFSSSCETLNRVWEFCKYSIKATAAFDFFIDGQRERLPYEGDTFINQLCWFCCCPDPAIPRRTINYLLKYPTWPTEWSLMMPMIVRDYALYTGDRAAVEGWLPQLESCLLERFTGADLLIRPQGKIRDIIDWPEKERDGYVPGSVNLVPNCFRIGAMNALAELMGNPVWHSKAERTKAAIRKTFLKNGYFVDSPETEHSALHSSIFPLFFHVGTPEECRPIRQAGMRCSVYASQFFLEALFRNGMAQRAIDLLCSTGRRSWLGMLEQGSTITMEAWSNEAKPNQDWNHAWGAAPANLIPRLFCGIRPLCPGFQRFAFDSKPGNVVNFALRHPTVAGAIELECANGKAELTVPDGTTALFRGRELKAGKHTLDL